MAGHWIRHHADALSAPECPWKSSRQFVVEVKLQLTPEATLGMAVHQLQFNTTKEG